MMESATPSPRPRFRVGTSGFYYEGWLGTFYPEDLKKNAMLPYYAERFDTVELNSTFYHLPKEKTVQGWVDRTPGAFRFAVKGSRFITHRKKLRDVAEPLDLFYERIAPFGRKLGCVLYQLPPSLRRDDDLLNAFLAQLPEKIRHTVEFRHASWFHPEVMEILKRHGVAFCAQSHPGLPDLMEATAPFVYLRFHGVPELYTSNYGDEELQRWANRIRALQRDAFVYFNNDFLGYAPVNAMTLRGFLTA